MVKVTSLEYQEVPPGTGHLLQVLTPHPPDPAPRVSESLRDERRI